MGSIARRVALGSIWLSTGQLLSTLVAFIGSIVVARLLSPDEYGLIGVALIFPGILPGLLDFGLSTALIRFTPLDNGRGYISTALTFRTSTALIAATTLYAFSDYMATLLARPYVAPMIRVLSIYVFGFMLVEALRSVLVGAGEYGKVAFIDILRNVLRVAVSASLILAGLGVYGAVWGFAVTSAGVLALSLSLLPRSLRAFGFDAKAFRELMTYSLPLYVPVVLGLPLAKAVDIYLARHATNFELGSYSVASNLLTPLGIIGGALATSIFSSLLLLLGNKARLREAVVKATIYTSTIVLPVSYALIVFSKPLVYVIYGAKYGYAPTYLSLMALVGLLAPLGSYVIGSYLNTVGATRKTMEINLVHLAVYILLATALIPRYSVAGVILSNLAASFSSTLYGIHLLCKEFSLVILTKRNILLLTWLSVPAITSALGMRLLPISIEIKTVIGVSTYLTTLAIVLPTALRKEEMIELNNTVKEIKVLNMVAPKIFQILLEISRIQDTIKSKIAG